MRFTEKLARKIVQFFKGSSRDTSPKIELEGTYYDAQNLVVRTTDGQDHVLSDTRGEVLKFGSYDAQMDNIGSFNVGGHLIECFCYEAGTSASHPAQIRIDGLVMVESDQLNWDTNHPLQGDTNERCEGGELFLTDNLNPILIFGVQNIIDCYYSTDPVENQTYFSGFNILLYQAILQTAPHHPIFVDLYSSTANGLYPGKYTYSIRYADETGNKTSWSVQTPYIPVPAGYSANSAQHPGVKTYGGSVGLTPTNWGITIKFRVDNVAGYEYIEVRRIAQWEGQGYQYVPAAYSLKLVPGASYSDINDIQVEKYQIVTFNDTGDISDWAEMTDEEDTEEISGFFTCKTLRYYNNRLVPMNITTGSKDVANTDWFITKNNRLGFPVIEKLTTATDRRGHYKPYNQVYYPTLQSGDYTGWGVYFTDGYGARSFVTPIDNLAGLDMKEHYSPNRRARLDPDSEEWSVTKWKGAVTASDVDSATGQSIGHVHEVFDLVGSISRPSLCTFKNIINRTGAYKALTKVNDGVYSDCVPATDQQSDLVDHVSGTHVGYNPFHPVSDGDETLAPNYDHNFRINTHVKHEYGIGNPTPTITSPILAEQEYHPMGFAPNYYSQGVGIWGLKDWPAWAKSFSVVRTPPAKRVVCQGIGYYNTYQTNASGAVGKYLNKLVFWSPDADDLPTGGMNGPNTWTEIEAGLNSGSYQVQLVSPLGAFMEVYDGAMESGITGWSRKNYDVDAVLYIRQLYEDGTINPTYNESSTGWGNGYISYGRWLNKNSQQATFWDTNSGEYVFDVNGCSVITEGRGKYMVIELANDIYWGGIMGHSNGNDLFDSLTQQVEENPQNYCEPFYVVNIVAVDRRPVYGNTTSYVETGHLQKIESRVGIWQLSYGNSQSFELVDERWEDCIPNYLNPSVADENRYVWVNNKRWINCTYKSVTTQNYILAQIAANGFYTDTDGNDSYGVYTHTGTPGTSVQFYLNFEIFNPSYDPTYFIPADGNEIVVKYDNRVPLKIFAGDKTVGESVFCPIDREQVNGSGVGTEVPQIAGYPYSAYHINERVFILNKAGVSSNAIQDDNLIYLNYIRQLMVNCILETTVNVPLMYGNEFPHVHYVMRPHKWENGNVNDSADPPTSFLSTDNKIFMEYADDYRNDDGTWEWQRPGWTFGGLRFLGYNNIDYNKTLNDRGNSTRPQIGWKEKTKYCTRIKWSQKRNINELDDPNLKSFPVNNTHYIHDGQGEIKYAYDNDSSKGNNLFAVTDWGVCMLITDKTLLADVNVNQIAYMVPDAGFIKGEYWLNKSVGATDEFWRGIAEFANTMFLPTRFGVYKLEGFELGDITTGRQTLLLPQLDKVGAGYSTKMTGAYDPTKDEYWLNFDYLAPQPAPSRPLPTGVTHIFSNGKGFWSGGAQHDYEDMIYCESVDNVIVNRIYGVRNYQAYKIGETYDVNGGTRVCEVTFHVCPKIGYQFELVDLFINSSICPSEVQYATTFGGLPEAVTPGSVIRNYGASWYLQVPRKAAAPNDRLQNDVFFVKLIFDQAQDVVVNSVDCGVKMIR